MKKIIIALLLLPFFCKGQNVVNSEVGSGISGTGVYKIVSSYDSTKIGTYVIEGDTMEALKSTYELLVKYKERFYICYNLLVNVNTNNLQKLAFQKSYSYKRANKEYLKMMKEMEHEAKLAEERYMNLLKKPLKHDTDK